MIKNNKRRKMKGKNYRGFHDCTSMCSWCYPEWVEKFIRLKNEYIE